MEDMPCRCSGLTVSVHPRQKVNMEMEDYLNFTDNLGKKFARLHQILLLKKGSISFWTGEAGEAFREKEGALYHEAGEVLTQIEIESRRGVPE